MLSKITIKHRKTNAAFKTTVYIATESWGKIIKIAVRKRGLLGHVGFTAERLYWAAHCNPTVVIMWYTYIIQSDTDRLYTGITTDIQRRWQEHANSPKGARFFRTCKPQNLCRLEAFPDRAQASQREASIKKLTRREKDLLIATPSPVALPELPGAPGVTTDAL